jgi:hypothetical protein
MPSRAEIVSFDNSPPHPGADPFVPGAAPDTSLVLVDSDPGWPGSTTASQAGFAVPSAGGCCSLST